MADKDAAQEILAREILEEGRRRAERIRADAQAEADKLTAQAEARARAEADQILAAGEERARKRAQMVLGSAAQETAQRKLRAREEVLREALEGARQELQRLDGASYGNTVAALAADALRRMPGDRFVLRAGGFSDAECAALRDALLAALRAEGRNVAVQCAPGAARGVIVESADGRLRWDNTFEARLNRMKAGLERLIAPALFGKS